MYFAFEYALDQARSLMQEIDNNAKEKDMIEYRLKYRKTNERKSSFEKFFCWIQVTDIRQRDSLQTKKSFDTPILALFLDES